MGKISAKANVSNTEDWQELQRYVSQFLQDCQNQVNGNLTFSDNLNVKFLDLSFSTANATRQIPHGLGRIPAMWISGNLSANAVIYQTKTSDNNNVYLAASAVCNVRILVI